MKRIVIAVLLLFVMVMPSVALASDGSQQLVEHFGPTGGGSMPLSTYKACCEAARQAYVSAAAQPPSLIARSNAIAAYRNSVTPQADGSYQVDKLLQKHWPGGYPKGGVSVEP